MMNRPNILLITSDRQHFDTLGIVNSRVKTPNLDRLALAGTHFTRELENLWDDPAQKDLKLDLLHKFENAEMRREPMPMPRIAVA